MDDKKLQTALKKLNVQPIQAIEEVNMFKSDGNVIHFAAPKGIISVNYSNFSPKLSGHIYIEANFEIIQFMPQFHQIHSLFTEMVKIKNLQSLFQEF